MLLRCETRIVSAKGFSEHSELSLETSDFGHFVSFCIILSHFVDIFDIFCLVIFCDAKSGSRGLTGETRDMGDLTWLSWLSLLP